MQQVILLHAHKFHPLTTSIILKENWEVFLPPEPDVSFLFISLTTIY